MHQCYCQTPESTAANKAVLAIASATTTTKPHPRSLAVDIPTSAEWSKKATLRFFHSWPFHVPCLLSSTRQVSRISFGFLALSILIATLPQIVGDMSGQTSDERLPFIDDIVTRTALHLASRPSAHNFCHCRPFLEKFHVKHDLFTCSSCCKVVDGMT